MCQQIPQNQLSGWAMKSGKQGVYYLHEGSSLALHTQKAARVAAQALSQVDQSSITGIDTVAQEDDELEDRDEVLKLCSSLDGVIGQLQKQLQSLKSYQRPLMLFKVRLWICMTCVHMCMLTRQAWH